MVGTVAQTIQGEAGSDPAHQFAVASVIYNRMQQGGFGGSTASAIVNAPSQFVGSAPPNASAQRFADAIQNGTLSQYGNTGNAVYFQEAGSNTTLGSRSPGVVNIGGNNFSDAWGSPTANFQAPQYGGSGANFTPPPGTPDTFSVSDTPGSQSNHPISDPTVTDTPGSVDPVTGQPDWILPDVNVNTPVVAGGAGSGGSAPGVGSGTGAQAQPGAGTPVQVNLGPQTASDLQSYVNAPIKAFQNWATTQFATVENWFSRGFLLVLAIIIILVALWRLTGTPSPQVIAQKVGKAAA